MKRLVWVVAVALIFALPSYCLAFRFSSEQADQLEAVVKWVDRLNKESAEHSGELDSINRRLDEITQKLNLVIKELGIEDKIKQPLQKPMPSQR